MGTVLGYLWDTWNSFSPQVCFYSHCCILLYIMLTRANSDDLYLCEGTVTTRNL